MRRNDPDDSRPPSPLAPTLPASEVPGPPDVATPPWSTGANLPEGAAPAPGPFIGRYQLLGEIGRGGMGVVYRAMDPKLRREVALKTLKRGEAAGPTERQRFLREARAIAALRHPGIIELYDWGEDGANVFFTMHLVQGPSLALLLAANGPLAPARAAEIAVAVGQALVYAHAHRIVHRDVKPGNILLDQGRPLLSDFGLARSITAESVELTGDVKVLGTLAYMAPELRLGQSRGAQPAADQYALGATLYEMLTGEPPELGSSTLAPSDRTPDLPANIPTDLAQICQRALSYHPEDRFSDMAAFVNALDRWIRGVPVFPLGTQTRLLVRRVLRQRASVVTVLVMLLVVLAVERGGVWWWRARAEAAREAHAAALWVSIAAQMEASAKAGRQAEADSFFSAFVEHPEHADTPALASAWLARGEQLQERGDTKGAVTALVTSYAVAPDPESQRRSLLALAHIFHATDAWGPLETVLGLLPAREPHTLGWRRDLAVTRRDIASGVRLNHDPTMATLLQVLGRATRSERVAHDAVRWELDTEAGGAPEIGLYDGKSRRFTVVSPSLPLPSRLELTGEAAPWRSSMPVPVRAIEPAQRVEGAHARAVPPYLIEQSGDRCALRTPRGEQLVALKQWDCVQPAAAALGDLDQDGLLELYFSDDRQLLRTTVHDDSAPVPADRALGVANSEVRAVLVEDVDGDGRAELVVVSGGWGAYDVRILQSEGGALVTRGRARLGDLRGLQVISSGSERWLAVVQEHDPTQLLNRRVFGESLPHGARQGIHLLRWAHGQFESRGFIPLPTPEARPAEPQSTQTWVAQQKLLAADLDGDGVSELILGVDGTWTWIYRLNPSGQWVGLALDEMFPLEVADLDADGDQELLVRLNDRGDEVWEIGAGDDHLPVLEPPQKPVTPPPSDLPDGLREAWRRAESLRMIGATDVAAERLEALARLARGTPAAAQALWRAAEIREANGQDAAAAALFGEAALDESLGDAALEQVFRVQMAARRFGEARAAAQARQDRGDPTGRWAAKVQRLHERLSVSSLTFDFAAGLDPRWRIDAPVGVSQERDGLRLQATGGKRLIHLPVRWLGGPIQIEVTLEDRRLDWGAIVRIGLAEAGGAPVQNIHLARLGGGGVYRRAVSCPKLLLEDGVGYAESPSKRVLWEFTPDEGRGSCGQWDASGREVGRVTYSMPADLVGTGALDLVVAANERTSVGEVLLQRVVLSGFEVREEARSSLQAAAAENLVGNPAETLRQLPGVDTPSRLLRVMALDGLGQAADVKSTLREALSRDPDLDGWLVPLLQIVPDRLALPLQEVLGARYYSLFNEAYGTLASMHPDAPETAEAYTRWLVGVERFAAGAPDTLLRVELMVRRAEAYRRRGRDGAARLDLARVYAAADPSGGPQLWSIHFWAIAAREEALLELHVGALDRAMAAVHKALRWSPTPEIMADHLATRAEFEPLRSLPGWELVEAARGVQIR